MADPCPRAPPEQPHSMVLKKLLDDMKAYWKAEDLAKRVTQERKLGVTIPGQHDA